VARYIIKSATFTLRLSLTSCRKNFTLQRSLLTVFFSIFCERRHHRSHLNPQKYTILTWTLGKGLTEVLRALYSPARIASTFLPLSIVFFVSICMHAAWRNVSLLINRLVSLAYIMTWQSFTSSCWLSTALRDVKVYRNTYIDILKPVYASPFMLKNNSGGHLPIRLHNWIYLFKLLTEREGIDINMNIYASAGEKIESKSNKCLNLTHYWVKRLS